MDGPTSLFDSYESDFKQIVSSIKGKLDGEAKEQKGGEFRLQTCTIVPCCAVSVPLGLVMH